jgi:RNA polymerase sigma-70 factor (ECF subfamily)
MSEATRNPPLALQPPWQKKSKESGTFAGFPGNYDLKTDEELLAELRRGREEALVEIFRRHKQPLYRFALNMTGSAEIAQEAVQDAFLALIRKPEAWQAEKGTVQSFLYGITRNVTFRAIAGHVEFEELDFDLASSASVLDDLDREERIRAVRDGVLSLPPVYREAVVFCDMEELSYEEASVRMACAVGTVRSRVSRGRAILASKLRARFAGRAL